MRERTVSPRARRVVGGGLVVFGFLLVSFASTRYLEGAVRAEQTRERWELARAHAAVQAIRAGGAAALPVGFERGAPVARLRVPRLGLDEIVVEGVGDRELNVGPGHLPGTVLPGQPGNSVISAHRDRHFLPLGGLTDGDTVITEVGPVATRWVVISRRIVKAGAPALFDSEDATLTLTTCWPIRFFGPAPDRLVITARPLDPGASAPRT